MRKNRETGIEPKIESIPIADLTLDPANVRKHVDRNKVTIRSSLKRFGAGRSVVLDRDNIVVAGNETVASAIDVGFTDVLIVEPHANQIVAVRRPEWTKTEATGYAIADNRSAELAEWDFEGLGKQLGALQLDGVDLNDLGWAPHEVEPLLAAEWAPPPVGDMPEGQSKEPHPCTVTFSAEQWEVVKSACDKVRKAEEDETIADNRCLELIAADWLAGV